MRAYGIELLVDVRTAPGSRKHPQFGRDSLARSLSDAGVGYEWRKDLGGWRKPLAGSQHTALTSAGFRGYADYMDTPAFGAALRWLMAQAQDRAVAYMCAESLWWRCHRSMISDALLARGWRVIHLLADGRSEPHRLRSMARLDGDRVIYDVEGPQQQELME